MSNRAYIPHGDYSLDPAQTSLALALLTRRDAHDLAPMLGLAADDEPRWVYDPIYRVQRAGTDGAGGEVGGPVWRGP